MVAVSLKKSFFQAEDGIRDASKSRGLGDVYKRQVDEDGLRLRLDDDEDDESSSSSPDVDVAVVEEETQGVRHPPHS